MATSQTVSTTVFKTRKIIDHAARRCGLVPQQIVGETLDTCLDILWMKLSELSNEGIPLWTITKLQLPLYERTPTILAPVGTVQVRDVNLRTCTRLSGTNSSSEGTADNAFDADLTTACTQVGAAGYIQTQLNSAKSIPFFGILPNASGTWAFNMQYSDDGITWTTLFSESAQAMVAGEWYWKDVEGVPEATYWRLQATGATVLDVQELVFQNSPREIPLYQLNRNDYSNLPDKTSTGRPSQFWFDKRRGQPALNIWPSPEAQYTFAQVVGYYQRYIQDVGTLQQEIEVPQRWYNAVVLLLAQDMVREIKEADINRAPLIDSDLEKALGKTWSGEDDESDSFLRVNIGPYTR